MADIVRGVKTDGVVLVEDDEPSGYIGADKKIRLNLEATCGGPALLNKDVRLALAFHNSGVVLRSSLPPAQQQTENLVMQLYLEGYLDIGKFHSLGKI